MSFVQSYLLENFLIANLSVKGTINSVSELVLEEHIWSIFHLRLGNVANGSDKDAAFYELIG